MPATWSNGSDPAQAVDPSSDSYDTALPPIQSQNMSLSRRRPGYRPDSAAIIGNFRGMQRPGAPFQTTPDPVSNMIARGPGMHRRSESTLRTVMRKIFHRKRRSQTDELEEDPVMESRSPRPSDSLPRKSVSRSRKDAQPTSLGTKNSPLQKDLRPTLMDLNKLDPLPVHRRRNTLPSLVFSEEESHDITIKDHGPEAGKEPENLRVRRALRNKRRSRSTNSLRRKANEHRMSPIQWTRRSTEITYLGSPAFGAVSDSELSFRPPTRNTVASLSKPDEPCDTPEVNDAEQQTEVESVPPSVGNLVHTMQNHDNLTIEQRVTTLEVKLIDLEFAIARLQDKRGDSSPTAKSTSKKSLTPDGRQPAPLFSPATGSSNSPRISEDRPVSTGTVRPNLHRSRTYQPPSSPPQIDGASSISIEQYSALVTLLRREQSARRNLEGQVSSLRDDIQQLQKMARDSMSMSMGTMYPIQSADSVEPYHLRPVDSHSSPQSSYIPRTERTIPHPHYDSGTGTDLERDSKHDLALRKLERRIEIAGMI